jgi:hypothetical protein
MTRIEGLKNISDGKYFLKKRCFQEGEIKMIVKFILIKKKDKLELWKDETDVTETLKSIEIKKNNEIFIWIKPSKIGVRYFAHHCIESE